MLIYQFIKFKKLMTAIIKNMTGDGDKAFVKTMQDVLDAIDKIFFSWSNFEQKRIASDEPTAEMIQLYNLIQKFENTVFESAPKPKVVGAYLRRMGIQDELERLAESEAAQHKTKSDRDDVFTLFGKQVLIQNKAQAQSVPEVDPITTSNGFLNQLHAIIAQEFNELLELSGSNQINIEEVGEAKLFYTAFFKHFSQPLKKAVSLLNKLFNNEITQQNLPSTGSNPILEPFAMLLKCVKGSSSAFILAQSGVFKNNENRIITHFAPVLVNNWKMRNRTEVKETKEGKEKQEHHTFQEFLAQDSSEGIFASLYQQLARSFLVLNEVKDALGVEPCQTILNYVLKNKNINLSYLPRLIKFTLELYEPKYGLDASSDKNFHFFAYLRKMSNAQINDANDWEKFRAQFEPVLLQIHRRKFPEKDMDQVISDFTKQSADVEFPISPDEMKVLVEQYHSIQTYGESLVSLSEDELKEKQDKLIQEYRQQPSNTKVQLALLAIIREQVKRHFGVLPYNVQMLNVLAFLNAPNKKRLAQIKTGEGKSLTIAMLAAIKALLGPVAITTSNEELAGRDVKKFEKFYKSLGLSCAACEDKNNDFSANIVYGTAYNFEHAYLYWGLGMQEHKPWFKVCIADEADTMFLDTHGNPAVISCGEKKSVAQAIYETVWKFIHEKDLPKNSETLEKYLSSKLELTKMPSRTQLEIWIRSATSAKNDYKENVDYVVKDDKIVIVDYKHTGQLNKNARWQYGIHTFLEIKHSFSKIRLESSSGASMNHFGFYTKFEELYALSGTGGPKKERENLSDLYGLSYYDSPPYRFSQKKIELPLIALNQKEHDEFILKDILEKLKAHRPILVLTETIEQSERLNKILSAHFQYKSVRVQLYNGLQKDSEEILKRAGFPNTITIATNTAGRGTDIKLTPEAVLNGGLAVINTSPAINRRVENQNFGRCGRQGEPGSARYILNLETLLDIMGKKVDTSNIKNVEEFKQSIFKTWSDFLELNIENYRTQRNRSCYINQLIFHFQELFFQGIRHCDPKTLYIKALTQIWGDTLSDFTMEEYFFLDRIHHKLTVFPLPKEDDEALKEKLLKLWDTFASEASKIDITFPPAIELARRLGMKEIISIICKVRPWSLIELDKSSSTSQKPYTPVYTADRTLINRSITEQNENRFSIT